MTSERLQQLQQQILDPSNNEALLELQQKIEREIQLAFEQKLSNKKVRPKSSTTDVGEMSKDDLDEAAQDKSESKG
jgi:hypothetical protein